MRKPSRKDAVAQIKDYFFQHPTTTIHLRELARQTGLSPPAVKRGAERLVKEGLLRREKGRAVTNFQAKDDERFRSEKQAWNINQLFTSGLIDHLEEALAHPTIILFGSYARGEDWEESDIDLFLITDEQRELHLTAYENKLKRTIQTFIHATTAFQELCANNPELMNNVLNGLTLRGFVKVLDEIRGIPPTKESQTKQTRQ